MDNPASLSAGEVCRMQISAVFVWRPVETRAFCAGDLDYYILIIITRNLKVFNSNFTADPTRCAGVLQKRTAQGACQIKKK
mmetsp:Transcript_34616/g.72607  ORF Transcript_34616/g.72607 Transcript_34616/m.72607 type:complete len:81 (+) Transcript_34616:38-280(+)